MNRLFLFMVWPLAEIALFVVLGGKIGLGATLLWIFATGLGGVLLLRHTMAQGAVMMQRGARGLSMREGKPVSGLFRAFAAVMLILPGFLTDFIGLLLLLPPVQAILTAAVMKRVNVVASGQSAMGADFSPRRGPFGGDDIIDGEWVEVPPQAARRNPPSRWVELSEDPEQKH